MKVVVLSQRTGLLDFGEARRNLMTFWGHKSSSLNSIRALQIKEKVKWIKREMTDWLDDTDYDNEFALQRKLTGGRTDSFDLDSNLLLFGAQQHSKKWAFLLRYINNGMKAGMNGRKKGLSSTDLPPHSVGERLRNPSLTSWIAQDLITTLN